MHDYRKLRVYEQAIGIAESRYGLTRTLPRAERYGLVDQLNRSAVSIAANIAEGAGRGDQADFARFLRIARGSAAELETLTLVAHRLGFVNATAAGDLRELAERIKAGLTNLERSIKPPT